ncbi:hypothetical protein [Neobittarella massiliensis]|nr:hypothetical protein [Neobittarella massiliensis]SCJ73341.1 Uncharacterised protein [uncultured Anaerotruncus sp.]
MQESIIPINAPAAVCLCIDSSCETALQGRAYYADDQPPICFTELGRVVLQLDHIFDEIGPQASTQGRRFGRQAVPAVEKKEGTPMAQITKHRGDKETFVVQIQYRQNATWQGKVTWADKDETKSFRSALELIKLIDSALDESESTVSQND